LTVSVVISAASSRTSRASSIDFIPAISTPV
jgi:hypothetical protein